MATNIFEFAQLCGEDLEQIIEELTAQPPGGRQRGGGGQVGGREVGVGNTKYYTNNRALFKMVILLIGYVYLYKSFQPDIHRGLKSWSKDLSQMIFLQTCTEKQNAVWFSFCQIKDQYIAAKKWEFVTNLLAGIAPFVTPSLGYTAASGLLLTRALNMISNIPMKWLFAKIDFLNHGFKVINYTTQPLTEAFNGVFDYIVGVMALLTSVTTGIDINAFDAKGMNPADLRLRDQAGRDEKIRSLREKQELLKQELAELNALLAKLGHPL